MVARTSEYHILGKRVPINGLRLGTILPGIQTLTRLNPGQEPNIDPERLCYWHDTNFKVLRDDERRGEGGAEFKVAALEGLGGDAKVDIKRGNTDEYGFSVVDTLEFESSEKDYRDACQTEGVQIFLKGTGYAPVFYITGIKVGRVSTGENDGPTFEATRVKNLGGSLNLGVNVPSFASVGPKASGAKNLTINERYSEHNDRIFAIRVKKLQYKRRSLFGARELVAKPYNNGAELTGEGIERQRETKPEVVFDKVEEIPLNEDEKDYEMITEVNGLGDPITYVVPSN